MYSKSLFSAVLFVTAALAQTNDYNIDEAEVSTLALARLNSAWYLGGTSLTLIL